jgi:tripartite-type tricarboxylate transporter receptor subunit TctC
MKKLFLTLLFSVLTAHATETIRVIVPYAAGGNTDLVARLYAKELAKQDIDVVVLNRPGANGFIGTQEVMGARPDGKTLLFSGVAGVVYSSVTTPAAYNAMNRLVPVIQTAIYGHTLVAHKSSDIKTFDQLRQALKTRSVAIGITDSTMRSAIEELFPNEPNLLMVNYSGDAQALLGLLNKSVEIATLTWSQDHQIQQGELVALAVVTAKGRNNVKSLIELGYGVSHEGWNGFWLPPETPKDIRDRLYVAIERARADQDLQKQITTVLHGSIAPKRKPEEFANVIDNEFAKTLARNVRRSQKSQ